MIDPNKCCLIQRADFAEAKGATPISSGMRSADAAFAQSCDVAPQDLGVHAELRLRELRPCLELPGQAGGHPVRRRVHGGVRDTDEKIGGPAHLAPVRQLPTIADAGSRRGQRRRIEIEYRLGVRLISCAGIVPLEQQKIGNAERGRAEELALQGDPISVAAGDLQDGLHTLVQQPKRGHHGVEVRPGPAPSVTLTASASPLRARLSPATRPDRWIPAE